MGFFAKAHSRCSSCTVEEVTSEVRALKLQIEELTKANHELIARCSTLAVSPASVRSIRIAFLQQLWLESL